MSAREFEVESPAPGRGRLLEANGDLAVFASSVASPPGSTLTARAPDLAIRIKVRSCKREQLEGELAFRIEGRFVNLSRDDRRKLAT